MEFIRLFGFRDLMFSIGHWDYRCFHACYHEFMLLIRLYLIYFLNLFLFFVRFNSGERLFHISIPW